MINNVTMRFLKQTSLFLKQHSIKFISALFLIALLSGTWLVFKKREFFNEELHLSIQDKFQEMIRAKLIERNPSVTDVVFHQLWTETIEQGSQIKAVFSYSFSEGKAKNDDLGIRVSGTALLDRVDDPHLGQLQQRWEIGQFKVNRTEMNFNKEVLLAEPVGTQLNLDGSTDPLEFENPSN